MADSMLSTEEQKIADRLAEGETPAEIAEATDRDPVAVEKAADRIREKTDRALATLLASPFTRDAVDDLAHGERERLLTVLEDE